MSSWELVIGALRLDPSVFVHLVDASGALRLGLLILIAAGGSQALGQSAALLANRVRPRRFLLALAISTGLFAASIVVWSAALSLSVVWLLDAPAPFSLTVAIVGLAHAPRIFEAFSLIPYFGTGITVTLTVWTYLATAVGARAAFGLDLPAVLLVVGAAWLLTELFGRTVGVPIVAATRRLRRWSAGGNVARAKDRA